MIERRDRHQKIASSEGTHLFDEAHYRLATEAAGIGLWDWELSQDRQIWTSQGKAIFGLAADAEVGYQRFLALLYPADRERVNSVVVESLTKRTEYDTEYRVIWPDGSLHWIGARGHGIYDDDGIPSRMIGVVFDITPRKMCEEEQQRADKQVREVLQREYAARIEAEAACQRSDDLVDQLKKNSAFVQAIINQTPCGLIIAEAPTGKIIACNAESSHVLGHSPLFCERYQDYAQYHAVHADGSRYRAEEYSLVRALLYGETIKEEESLYQRQDGSIVHLVVSAAPILDGDGRLLAAVTTFHDISERYEIERKKDEFISMASHELRTPLTSIKGNLQLVQRRLQNMLEGSSELSREEREIAEHLALWTGRALRQVNVESRLINDLLDASRIQTDQLRVALEPGNLVQIVCDAVLDVQAGAEIRAIDLEMPAQTNVPVMADSVRIGQVITNYLSNALKYSPADQPITVGLTLSPGEARVWVRDSGPGISQEALNYIWDRFRQVGSFVDYTRLGGGLGLGLYINQALVQLHGGRSGVESQRSKGSTFWFTLPLVEQEPA